MQDAKYDPKSKTYRVPTDGKKDSKIVVEGTASPTLFEGMYFGTIQEATGFAKEWKKDEDEFLDKLIKENPDRTVQRTETQITFSAEVEIEQGILRRKRIKTRTVVSSKTPNTQV